MNGNEHCDGDCGDDFIDTIIDAVDLIGSECDEELVEEESKDVNNYA